MIFNTLRVGIKAAIDEARRKKDSRLSPKIKQYVSEYLDAQPEEAQARIIGRIVGAAGLTDTQFKRLFEASGDKMVELHFANGDTALIRPRTGVQFGGPGW